jgi:hypothetical protein
VEELVVAGSLLNGILFHRQKQVGEPMPVFRENRDRAYNPHQMMRFALSIVRCLGTGRSAHVLAALGSPGPTRRAAAALSALLGHASAL